MSELVIASGKYRGKRIVVPKDGLVIGRDRGCQMRISSDQISRVHCKFALLNDRISVKDLGSRNGTFVNGKQIEEMTHLDSGDVVKVGPLALEIRKKQANESGMSDDDIASWLQDDTVDGKFSDDSTLVPDIGNTNAELSTTIDSSVSGSSASSSSTKKKKFRSLGEEAADIIQRHWEQADSKKESNENSPTAS